jgi:hypothetical protein
MNDYKTTNRRYRERDAQLANEKDGIGKDLKRLATLLWGITAILAVCSVYLCVNGR